MKKIFFILFVILMISFTSCRMPIVGDKYIVTDVSAYGNYDYKMKYTVKIRCMKPIASKFTFYTDKLYTVGDTITIQ